MEKKALSDYRRTLGVYLKTKRGGAGLTQDEVGRQLKLHPQFLSNIERGVTAVPNDVFRKLVRIYSIPEGEILGILDDLQTKFWKNILFGKSQKRA